MEQAIYLLLGAGLTWTFYFVQRRVERRNTSEAIDRSAKLLALKQGLEGANTTLEELRRFESSLIGKAETAVRIADTYVTQAEDLARQYDLATLRHNDMNAQAVAAFEAIDARLARLVRHLRRQLDGEGLATFETAHAAWLAFRARYARFIAHSYSGGAIRPLIHAVTLESITAAWITELETQLGDDDASWAEREAAAAAAPETP